jgi:hypothetical protein
MHNIDLLIGEIMQQAVYLPEAVLQQVFAPLQSSNKQILCLFSKPM